MRVILYLFASLALVSVMGEVAAQTVRPRPPLLAAEGQPFPEIAVSGNGAPAGGVAPESILFAEDWEDISVGVKIDDFGPWTRVSAGAGQSCSITEIVSSGGPKSGNALRAFLEDSGSCGRAEIRLPLDALTMQPTYLGSLPVPDYDTIAFTDHFIYTTDQAVNCTSNCNPDEIGYMFSTTLTKWRDEGAFAILWQNLRPTAQHSPSPPYNNSTNPNWPIYMNSNGGLQTWRRVGPEFGGNGVNWPVAVPSDFGLGSENLEGQTLDIYMIFRPDSRTDAEGGNGEVTMYIELDGNEPTTPKFQFSGSTIYPGKYQYRSSDGSGPFLGLFSTGIYNDPWYNNGVSTMDSVEQRIDNLMVVKNPDITEMYNTMQLTDFSSLGW